MNEVSNDATIFNQTIQSLTTMATTPDLTTAFATLNAAITAYTTAITPAKATLNAAIDACIAALQASKV